MSDEWQIKKTTAILSGVILALVVFGFGFSLGKKGVLSENISLAGVTDSGMPEGVDFDPVWKAWHIIDERFVPVAVATSSKIATTTEQSNRERVWGMVAGLAASLNDPYTFFLPPTENKTFSDDISGSFEGVGMEIAVRDEVLTVVSPLKGTPSEKAGLKSGDKILKIDGVDTHGMDVSTAVSKIRGKGGTVVVLTVLREGWTASKDISVTRGVISIPIITTMKRPDNVFVIQLSTFTANSADLFRNALREFVESGSDKLIIDLRGNPGGYLESAVDMASWFLSTGRVVVTEDYAGHAQNIVHRSRGYDVFTDKLKMVVLVDRGSASASEILADALRFYGKATLVGEPTFGKGSVQELVNVTSDTSLKITIARWLGPDGKQIPNTGIVPDTQIKNTEADVKAGKDPQLEKAAEVLLGK